MCTAITYQPRELYMGRSLDYEASYGEEIVMLPRRFPLRFRHGGGSEQGYAILGTAHVADGYPLYYDAVNEKGLGIAGLNFVGNAHYAAPQDGRQNVAQFEFIPWLLRQCAADGIRQHQRGSAGGIHLAVVVFFDNFDVKIASQYLCSFFGKLAQQRNAQ